jgi:asparagine synthase (glutamine-hydrolysing)
MCGIVGTAKEKQTAWVAECLSLLSHRGPDESNQWSDDHHTLGHARLSIVDLESGSQPMHSPDGKWHIVFNGEIYNHVDIRRALGENRFRTRSDTEVILHLALSGEAPEQWIRRLDGMFAFALTNGSGLVLARDPLGIKPLYMGQRNEAMVFASELKALADAENVREFPPGHFYTSAEGLKKYYRIRRFRHQARDAAEVEEELLDKLDRAVRKRLMADVPLGVFLSGGLDSSLIAALARRYKAPLDTFCVGTEDSEDLCRARQVAEALDVRHHERLFTIPEAVKALPEVIYHLESFDAALVRSAIPNFFLAKLARQHVKVALAGEGADELFAGYEYLKRIDIEKLESELHAITASLHNTNLQRCDRMSMAHSLEVRVPFLDVEVVDFAFRIPVALKQRGVRREEKWILRKVAQQLIPHRIAWRKKEKFAMGSGLGSALAHFAEREITDAQFVRERVVSEDICLRSKEELLYYRLFREMFPRDGMVRLVGRSRSI